MQLLIHALTSVPDTWWRHQMETFSALLALCAGNSPCHRWIIRTKASDGALMFSLICTWINGQVNNPEASNFRRHPAHYDGTVMYEKIWAIYLFYNHVFFPAHSQISKTLRLISIRHWHDTFTLDWCLIVIDLRAFAIWVIFHSGERIATICAMSILRSNKSSKYFFDVLK